MQDDSQGESEEWEGEGGEGWERGEGSGESENSEAVCQLHGEGGDGMGSSGSDEEEGEVSEREWSKSEEEEDVEEQKDTLSDPVGEEENQTTDIPGVREISENKRETLHNERDSLHHRVGHLSLTSHHNNPCIVKPITTPVTPPHVHVYSSTSRRQWLLEVTLVLLVTTLLLTVCSRLSYEWVTRVFKIDSEKPI